MSSAAMTSTFASLRDPAPYHLLAYGTLLGSTLFQSFIGGVVAFRVLPRPQFASLQTKIFPVYFTLQTLVAAALYLTRPRSLSTPSSTGLTVAMAAAACLNLVLVGPRTTAVMRARKRQETRDAKKSYDPGPHSPEMLALNRKFAVLHAVSSATNLVVLGAAVAYAFLVGARL